MITRNHRFHWLLAVAVTTATVQCLADENTLRGNLLIRSGWVHFDVVSGRISVPRSCVGQNRTSSFQDPQQGISETLSVSSDDGHVSVSYDRSDPRQHLALELVDNVQLDCQWEPRGQSGGPALRFRQRKRGKLVLELVSDAGTRRYVGDSFWHLVLAHPDVCRKHLIPVLQQLRADWQLVEAGRRVEQALLRYAADAAGPDAATVQRLVGQLGADDFATRQQADRQLRQMGPFVRGYLERLDTGVLSAEQRLRVREILASLDLPFGDRPERVAAQLVGDPAVWLVLLERAEPKDRLLVAQHLQRAFACRVEPHRLAERQDWQRQLQQLRAGLGLR